MLDCRVIAGNDGGVLELHQFAKDVGLQRCWIVEFFCGIRSWQ